MTYVHNVVLACPGATWDEYVEQGTALAQFYADLLGMRIVRTDWLKIGKDEGSEFQLAFGDGPGAYRPPVWGDPSRPQQLHLDIATPDAGDTEAFVVARGATRLGDGIYADPVGHPFCLYADDVAEPTVGRIVHDASDLARLAAFYAELMDMSLRVLETTDRVVIARDDASLPMLAFQRAEFTPARWPDPEFPQQVHLDIYAEHAGAMRDLAVRLGATALPPMGGSCPVFADPDGHPFCLCAPGE